MRKTGYFIIFAVFIICVFAYKIQYNSVSTNPTSISLPDIGISVNSIAGYSDGSGNNSLSKENLPIPARAKNNLDITNESKEKLAWKTKKTPYSYRDDVKTILPRLTKEEIEKAPVVDILRMNYNGEDIEVVVVEKDGKTYDTSDGVIIFVPVNYDKIFKENREKIRRGGR